MRFIMEILLLMQLFKVAYFIGDSQGYNFITLLFTLRLKCGDKNKIPQTNFCLIRCEIVYPCDI